MVISPAPVSTFLQLAKAENHLPRNSLVREPHDAVLDMS